MTARFNAKMEYRAMATTTCELTWILHLLQDLHVKHEKPALMYCDNQAALHIAANPVFHERSKHIEADCHVVRNKILDGGLKTFYVSTKDQLTDVFTKALGIESFLKLIRRLGVINIFASIVAYPHTGLEEQKARAVLLRGSVKNTSHVSQQKCTKEASNAAVTDDKSVEQAEKTSAADDEKYTRVVSNGSISTEVLEMVEAMPDHEFFIQ